MTERIQKSYLIPIAIGLVSFFYSCGYRVLNPEYVQWLFEGDSIQHYLGWLFYKNSEWTLPIGSNPDWGLENASSILYSDSIPLFAIIFKALQQFFPDEFQYFGIWFLLSFILQSIFSWRICNILRIQFIYKLILTSVLTLSPIMIHRIIACHQSLTGHFFILWAFSIYLCDNYSRKSIEWFMCIVLSLLVHPYICLMCLCIISADFFNTLFIKKQHDYRIWS